MAFVVEDGTGLADANSYTSVQYFRDYWTSRGVDYTAKTDLEVEAILVQSTFYIDDNYLFVGVKMTDEQALEFPRSNAVDVNGFDVVGVPTSVKRATAEAGKLIFDGSISFGSVTNGGVKKEKVDVLEVEYFQSSSSKPIYPSVKGALRPVLIGGSFGNGFIVRY